MTDPLRPHLLDLLADPVVAHALILAGAYGLQLVGEQVEAAGAETLVHPVPELRATEDLDFFLRLECFVRTDIGRAVRARLDGLGYAELTPLFQFAKPLFAGAVAPVVKVDVLSRLPDEGEAPGVTVRSHRVGAASGIGLHGHEVPEGFAVEDAPRRIPVDGLGSAGMPCRAEVQVPSPYAWLNLKVAAAGDWMRADPADAARKDQLSKHVRDVYVLAAMLTRDDLALCADHRDRYVGHPRAAAPREDAVGLFAAADAPGSRELRRQVGAYDHATLWEALCEVLGIGRL